MTQEISSCSCLPNRQFPSLLKCKFTYERTLSGIIDFISEVSSTGKGDKQTSTPFRKVLSLGETHPGEQGCPRWDHEMGEGKHWSEASAAMNAIDLGTSRSTGGAEQWLCRADLLQDVHRKQVLTLV